MTDKALNHDPRLYSRVEVLEHTVGEVKTAVVDLSKAFRVFVDRQQEQPRPIPFKEIAATMAATLAVVFGVLSFLDARHSTSTKISSLELQLELSQFKLELAKKENRAAPAP